MGRGRGRKGGGGGRGGRGGGGDRGGGDGGRMEDQYGETMVGQDKGEHFGFGGRGGAGGGTKGGDAGSRSGPGGDVNFIRHVPKFLQAHAHMLNKPVEEEPEATVLNQKYDDGSKEEAGDDEDEQQEALRRAIEQDPSLLQQHPELQAVAHKAEAEQLKAQGNAAFTSGKLQEAVQLFTKCIQLDGGNHIYFSNRAAAYTGLKNYKAAVLDALQCTEIRPQWAKGWSRLGAAYFGLEDFSEAREAYEKAFKLEPSDTQLQLLLQRAAAQEGKVAAAGRHKFKRRIGDEIGALGGQQEKRQQTVRPSAAKKENTLLSFGGDEEDEVAA